MTVQNILNKSSQILKKYSTTPLLDAEVFLCEAIKKPREFILANPDFELSENPPAGGEKKFWEMVERRKKYEPVAYIVNKKEFFGLEFYVDSRVLIPRPETEMMVVTGRDLSLRNHYLNNDFHLNIIDIGTGSGCIIAAIAKNVETQNLASLQINFFAIDYSEDSLKIAKKNFKNLNLSIKVLQGDLLEPYLQYCSDRSRPVTTIEIILANLPYLNAEEYENCPQEVKKYEPKTALYGGKDGLKYIKKLIAQIEKSGLENYYLILEISPSQAEYLRNLGFEIKRDLFEVERFATYISPPNGGGG